MSKSTLIMILCGSLLALATSWWVAENIFHRAPITTDEQSYLLQAQLLSQGRIKYPPPSFVQPFRYPMVIVDAEHGWMSRYPPGHPLWMVPGIWMGEPYIMVALAAGVGVVLTAGAISALGGSVGLGVLLLLISPFFVFTYGTMMSHTSGLVGAAGMLLAYVRWRQSNRSVWAIIAGGLWAWLFLNRTYTALLMAIPFAVDALLHLWTQRTQRQAWVQTILFAGFACGGIALIMVYNYLALGHPLRMTYLFYDPTDKLGFGLRHYWPVYPGPEPVMHTVGRAFSDLKNNILLLDQWLLGVRGGLLVWLALAISGWSRRWSGLLLGSIVVVPLGYLLFWYPGWNETGPNYYFEVFPAMVVMASMGGARLWQWCRKRRGWAWAICALSLLLGGWLIPPFFADQAEFFQNQTRLRANALETMGVAPPQSLIMVDKRVVERAWRNHDLVFSPHGVEGNVIVARYMPASNRALFRYFSDFEPKRLIYKNAGFILDPIRDEPSPLDVTVPIADWHRITGTNVLYAGGNQRLVRVARPPDPPGPLMFRRYFYIYPGEFTFTLEVKASGPDVAELLLTEQGDKGRILKRMPLVEADEWTMMEVPLTMRKFLMLEPIIMYAGHGEVQIRHARIYERPSS